VDAGGLVPAAGRPTTVKTRVLARHQQMLRVDRERTGPLGEGARDAVLGAVRDALGWADVVAVVDYDKGVLDEGAGARIVEAAGEAGVPAVVDPKLRNFGGYPGAFLFKPNGRELAAALGEEAPPRTEAELERVRAGLSCRHLLVTLGADGMVLVDGDRGRVRRIPSRAREVFDVSGAGDTVTAVLAAVLGSADDMADAAAMANFAAGLAVSRLGAVPVGRAEILEALDERDGGPPGPGGEGRPERRAPGRTQEPDDAPEGRREPAAPRDHSDEGRS
jgi:D-beta-D-heptose 7-phosphate kinase/D-beta-D-heptose 1-phosphate adenosyltransferase